MANEEHLSILKQGDTLQWNRLHFQHRWIDLNGADLSGFHFRGIDTRVIVPDEELGDDIWGRFVLSRVGLREANLRDCSISGAVLMGTDFSSADLTGADMSYSFLNGANLSNANLSYTDLRGAEVDGAIMEEANFFHTRFNGNTSFMEADLTRTKFAECEVWGSFPRANLTGTKFIECNVGARFIDANLKDADFTSSDLSNAEFGGTLLCGLDLSTVRGLEKASHRGPSIIGVDTLVKSKGAIPDAFLRGCGLSDWEIEQARLYNPDLGNEEINEILYKVFDLRATRAIQVSNLFISYSHRDTAFVDKVEAKLNEWGVRNWRDIHDMRAGPMEKQIDRAIRQNPTVLLVLSNYSLNSDWVQHEVRVARGLEKELGRHVLCPVALDGSWENSPWPRRIMEQILEYHVVDFSQWQDNGVFDRTFRKLIDGLELFYKG